MDIGIGYTPINALWEFPRDRKLLFAVNHSSRMPLLYIMLNISVAVPILTLVMATMMDGSVSVNPQTGMGTVMKVFDSAWQIIRIVSVC